jgi:hypothetical protein
MASLKTRSPLPSLPPRVPTTLAELDQLLMMLGHRTKTELNPKAKARLLDLAGAYPDATTAARWKAELRQIRKELLAEGSTDLDEDDP